MFALSPALSDNCEKEDTRLENIYAYYAVLGSSSEL